jgi:hypothetical protein
MDRLNYLQSQQPQQSQQNQAAPIQYVNGRASADQYMMGVNSSALLMDSTQARFYIKTTDAAGMSSVKAYDFEEAKDLSTPVEISTQNFVTREEFDQLKESLKNESTTTKPATKSTTKSASANS